MNVASTVEIASVVDPNTSPSSRVHSISRISPDAPDRKKQASRTARISGRTLYDRRRAAGYSRANQLNWTVISPAFCGSSGVCESPNRSPGSPGRSIAP